MHRRKNLGKAGQSMPGLGREIGAPVKGLQVRGEKYRHGPAAMAGQSLHRSHVDLIKIGPFLPVHLDADKIFVEKPGHLRVFKGFMSHDVAPVTGGIADGEKNRLVLLARQGKGLFSPREPGHRVEGMLEEIGAFFRDEAVGLFPLSQLPVDKGLHGRGGCHWYPPLPGKKRRPGT